MKPKRCCLICGASEKIDPLGYTNIAPNLDWCIDCVALATQAGITARWRWTRKRSFHRKETR